MPFVKPAVRPNETNVSGKANIKIRISHRRRGDKNNLVREIATTWYIEPKYMLSSGQIKSSYSGAANLNSALLAKVKECNDVLVKRGGLIAEVRSETDQWRKDELQ